MGSRSSGCCGTNSGNCGKAELILNDYAEIERIATDTTVSMGSSTPPEGQSGERSGGALKAKEISYIHARLCGGRDEARADSYIDPTLRQSRGGEVPNIRQDAGQHREIKARDVR